MRKLGWAGGLVTLLASGAYVFIYLYRWEWHRALFVAVVFVAAEVALATGMVLRRMSAPSPVRPSAVPPRVADPHVAARIQAAPSDRDHFAWLARDLSRTNVFVTTLLGGGAVLTAGAWALDRVAHRTAGPAVARSLAAELGALQLPADGLVADDAELLASEAPYADDAELRLLLGPHQRRP